MTPSCLGSTVIFDGEGVICCNCSHYPVCESRVTERLAEMKMRLGPAKRRVRKEPVYKPLDANDRARIEEVEGNYKKAGTCMRAILKNRICMDDLANRRNPFVNLGSHEYMMVACDALLNNGTITRSDLADKFTSVFGWSKKTANSHVGVVFAVLEHYGVIA